MERNYFEQPIPQYRTPRMHALNVPDKGITIHLYACSPDNSLDQDRWFYSTEIRHRPEDDEQERIERHFYLTMAEAMLYRTQRAGETTTYMTIPQDQGMAAFLNNEAPPHLIARVDTDNAPTWDGYTLQEVLNIRG